MTTLPEGKLFRVPGTSPVYLVSGGKKYWITHWIILDEMIKMGLPGAVWDTTQEEIASVPQGEDITSANQGMALYQATIKEAPILGAVISPEWWKRYFPWIGVGGLAVILTILLMRRK